MYCHCKEHRMLRHRLVVDAKDSGIELPSCGVADGKACVEGAVVMPRSRREKVPIDLYACLWGKNHERHLDL